MSMRNSKPELRCYDWNFRYLCQQQYHLKGVVFFAVVIASDKDVVITDRPMMCNNTDQEYGVLLNGKDNYLYMLCKEVVGNAIYIERIYPAYYKVLKTAIIPVGSLVFNIGLNGKMLGHGFFKGEYNDVIYNIMKVHGITDYAKPDASV